MSFLNAPLICPFCGSALTQIKRRLACANDHSFDIAREGYVNLLRPYKKMHNLGDGKEMLRARRAFLQRGHYAAISTAINRVVVDFMARGERNEPNWVADMGCGEGYYLHQLTQHLPDTDRCCGFDISKEAVRLAARQNKQGAFAAVNINRQIPLASQSIHVLLNLFAPRNASEFARVLAPGGVLIVVIPTEEHLHEWRTALAQQGATPLPIAAEKQRRTEEQFTDAFEPFLFEQSALKPWHVQNVCYTIQLDRTDLENLLQMTPNAWHISPTHQQQARQLAQMYTTVSVQILTFRRR